jgi:hypothetical protein
VYQALHEKAIPQSHELLYTVEVNNKQRLILVVSILASVVSAIDGFIVNVALPTISRQLGGGLVT